MKWQQWKTQLDQQLAPWRARYEQLPQNDKRAVWLMVTVVSMALAYWLLSSTYHYQQRALSDYKKAREDYRWMVLNQALLQTLVTSSNAVAAGSNDTSLIAVATESAKTFKLTFKRYQPEGETGLRLWIEAGEFDQTLRWLDTLQAQGVVLEQFDVDKLDKQIGMVDARVLLRRD